MPGTSRSLSGAILARRDRQRPGSVLACRREQQQNPERGHGEVYRAERLGEKGTGGGRGIALCDEVKTGKSLPQGRLPFSSF